MFKRKLSSLNFHASDNFSIDDEKQFRNLIVWLEDQKIRYYKIEDREPLRKIGSDKWDQIYQQYLKDLNCPYNVNDRNAIVDWLLGIAVRAEYGDNVELYKAKTAESMSKTKLAAPQVVSSNPLDSLDFDDPEFKSGTNKLTQLLNITKHPDHLITLQAVSKVIVERLSTNAIEATKNIQEGTAFPLEESDLGFNTGDKVLNQAAKILRLLYIHDLRDLQTKINEAIVSVQAITANPKTDTSLGKVGK